MRAAAICAAAAIALGTHTSCAVDEGNEGKGPEVNFTAGIKGSSKPGALTRTTGGGDEWVAGDAVGIYMLQTGGAIPAGVISNMGNKRYNVTDAASGSLAADVSTTPVIEYPLSGAAVDFAAYYPYSDATDNRVNGNGLFTVSLADQSDPARIDVLTAKTANKTSGPIALQFEHALSKITLNIRLADGVTTITNAEVADIADVKLNATPGSAMVNVATGAVADGPNAQIALLKAADAATDYDATFSAIIAPTSGTDAGGRYLTIPFEGRSFVWSIPATDIFLQGQNYIYWGEITENDFRVTESNITPWNENAKVAVNEVLPAKIQGNRRITWNMGRYALTTEPTNAGLYFKFGSVVGIYSGNGGIQVLHGTNNDTFEAANDVAWSPNTMAGNGAAGWVNIPMYSTTDYPKEITPESGYHTINSVRVGKGDPCRLVGLDLAKIKSTAESLLTTADIDNGKWRLPTPAEQQSFSGREANGDYTEHWTTQSGIKGGMFPNTTIGDATTFLPAAGYRNLSTGQVTHQSINGYYWSSAPGSDTEGRNLGIGDTGFTPLNSNNYAFGFNVRCVRQ
jgi:hypothetical protein